MQSVEDLLNTPIEGRLLRAREIAFRLGISIPTLYHWEKTEGFPARIRLGPNSVAWKGDEVKQWLDDLAARNDS